MLSIPSLPHAIVLGLIGLLIWAVICDFTSLRIPNRLPLAVALLFAAYATAAPGAVDWLGGLLMAMIVFVVATVLFHFRVMGGGDVKLMAAVALWAGPQGILGFLLITSLVGGLLALIAITPLRFVFAEAVAALGGAKAVRGAFRGVIPYGIAIAAGGLFVASSLMGA